MNRKDILNFWHKMIPLTVCNLTSPKSDQWLDCPFCNRFTRVKLRNWERHLYKEHDINGNEDKISYTKQKLDCLEIQKFKYVGKTAFAKTIPSAFCLITNMYYLEHFELRIEYLRSGFLENSTLHNFNFKWKILEGEQYEKHL